MMSNTLHAACRQSTALRRGRALDPSVCVFIGLSLSGTLNLSISQLSRSQSFLFMNVPSKMIFGNGHR